MKSFGELGRR